jgi:hypothetical protein
MRGFVAPSGACRKAPNIGLFGAVCGLFALWGKGVEPVVSREDLKANLARFCRLFHVHGVGPGHIFALSLSAAEPV